MREGCVYFIEADDQLVKIGFTVNLRGRFSCHRSSNPGSLRLIGAVRGSTDLEKDLHARFKADRVRGEWFKPSASLTECISDLMSRDAVDKDFRMEPEADPYFQEATKAEADVIGMIMVDRKCQLPEARAIASERFGLTAGFLENLRRGRTTEVLARDLYRLREARVILMKERLEFLQRDLTIATTFLSDESIDRAREQLAIARRILSKAAA